MNKYQTSEAAISRKLQQLRKDSGLKQAAVAQKIHLGNGISRSSISDWENATEHPGRLPSISQLIDLCNLYEVDFDYVLGASDIKSKDKQIMSQTLHLSERSLNLLTKQQTGNFIDYLLTDPLLQEVAQVARQISMNNLIADVLTTSFTAKFAKKVQHLFEDYYFSVFPMDMSAATFQDYLAKKIPAAKIKEPTKFLQDNFLVDGQLFVANRYDHFKQLPKSTQYAAIIASITAISYDYCVSAEAVKRIKQRLSADLNQILENIINQLTTEAQERIRRNLPQATK